MGFQNLCDLSFLLKDGPSLLLCIPCVHSGWVEEKAHETSKTNKIKNICNIPQCPYKMFRKVMCIWLEICWSHSCCKFPLLLVYQDNFFPNSFFILYSILKKHTSRYWWYFFTLSTYFHPSIRINFQGILSHCQLFSTVFQSPSAAINKESHSSRFCIFRNNFFN